MGERITKRHGKKVFINEEVFPRENCRAPFGTPFCKYAETCPKIKTRECHLLRMIDKLADYEDREEAAKPHAIDNVPTHFYGMEIEKAIEVVKAYKEDRAELLPCPVGAKVWLLLEKEHGVFDIVESQFVSYIKKLYPNISRKGETFYFYIDIPEIGYTLEFPREAFGKEIFFNYSDAVKMQVSKTLNVPISVLYNPKTVALFEAFLNNGEVKDENGSLSPEISERMLNTFLKGAEE